MTQSEKVIDSIFEQVGAEDGLSDVSKELKAFWEAGQWEPERILAAITAASEAK